MKYLYLIMIAVSIIACSSEAEIEIAEKVNFSGTYLTEIKCDGSLSDSYGEIVTIIISSTSATDTYTVDLGDEVIFQAIQENNRLIIEEQTLNEDGDFDVVTLEGELAIQSNDEVEFNFEHEVDDEGRSSCSLILVKQ